MTVSGYYLGYNQEGDCYRVLVVLTFNDGDKNYTMGAGIYCLKGVNSSTTHIRKPYEKNVFDDDFGTNLNESINQCTLEKISNVLANPENISKYFKN